jgi:DNA-binding transcriptional ArsR family regulator
MIRNPKQDMVWQALSDPVRRGILEFLTDQPRLTGEICELFQKSARLSRPAVLRHLDLLVQAKLIKVRAEGRRRINRLDATLLEEVCLPWLSARKQAMRSRLERLKTHVESKWETK